MTMLCYLPANNVSADPVDQYVQEVKDMFGDNYTPEQLIIYTARRDAGRTPINAYGYTVVRTDSSIRGVSEEEASEFAKIFEEKVVVEKFRPMRAFIYAVSMIVDKLTAEMSTMFSGFYEDGIQAGKTHEDAVAFAQIQMRENPSRDEEYVQEVKDMFGDNYTPEQLRIYVSKRREGCSSVYAGGYTSAQSNPARRFDSEGKANEFAGLFEEKVNGGDDPTLALIYAICVVKCDRTPENSEIFVRQYELMVGAGHSPEIATASAHIAIGEDPGESWRLILGPNVEEHVGHQYEPTALPID
jgi:hypothetical protein